MGYDITFHPITPEEIQYFLFDVLIDGRESESRIDDLVSRVKDPSQEEENRCLIVSIYEDLFPRLFPESGPSTLSTSCISYACGIISSFLHPCWYVKNMFLSTLINKGYIKDGLFTSFLDFTHPLLLPLIQEDPLCIEWNYRESGYVPPEKAATIEGRVRCELEAAHKHALRTKEYLCGDRESLVDRLKRLVGFAPQPANRDSEDVAQLDERIQTIETILDPENTDFWSDFLWALHHLSAYCQQHNTGFIEVADLVIPVDNEIYVNVDNFHTTFWAQGDEKTFKQAYTERMISLDPRLSQGPLTLMMLEVSEEDGTVTQRKGRD
jgi:hypothetical protein